MRCFGEGKDFYEDYHDREWGVPVHDDRHLFEMLCLEGAQAGLSWEIILKRREAYRKAFHRFDVKRVIGMSDDELESLIKDSEIVKNRLKIYSVRRNAIAFQKIQEEFGSFDTYIWKFVDGKPKIHFWTTLKDIPCQSLISDAIAKDLKKRGMNFVGSKIIYSFMQAVGLVNDHLSTCPFKNCSLS